MLRATCSFSFLRLSFYSGHSSFGMYCMLFLAVSLFLRGLLVGGAMAKSFPSLDLSFSSCKMGG